MAVQIMKYLVSLLTYYEFSFAVSIEGEDTDYIFAYNGNGELFITYNALNGFNVDTDLPDMTDSVIGFKVFDSLEFTIFGKCNDKIYNTLEYSPQLRNLNIKYRSRYQYTDYFLSYKHKENLISSDQPNYNTNCLQMKYDIPAQHYFNLVAAHLYYIETVWLQTKVTACFHDDSVKVLTCFKKLKKFIYSNRNLRLTMNYDNQKNGFVLLKYINGEEQYCYRDEENNKNAQLEYLKNPNTP
ncbi:hypothetical protein BDF21DRAFT_458613 [Thamnidium elegans]|nr:hypothetical protein BDF21DRAFT_458613 [Thamnidium elegans]